LIINVILFDFINIVII